jgi:hypothetical protein
MIRLCCRRLLPAALFLAPCIAFAQTAPQPTADTEQRAHVEQQLQELLRSRQDLSAMQQKMQKQMADFDARIAALEAELGKPPPRDEIAQTAPPPKDEIARRAVPPPAATAEQTGEAASGPGPENQGPFKPGTGLVLAQGDNAGLALGVNGYVRYLNQGALKSSYTDAFGRTFDIRQREDVQLNRLQVQFRGWMFDEKFRWVFYVWTQNPSQGDAAQVVVGGNINYTFSDALRVFAGIFSVPSTRSTAQSFPNWLSIDHRGMADEFFRGSYSQGFQAMGKLPFRFFYNASVTDNLSILGVSANQLAYGLNTYSGALYWMPTTGEFGPGFGFGDYEDHKDLATLLGVHFTRSRENAQDQPNTNTIENVQLRLSDGTILFTPDAFNTNGSVRQATYKMLALDGGLKYHGWSIDAEYYTRWVNHFSVIGTVPVTHLYDNGFQVLLSGMLIQKELQAYVLGSAVFGQYGKPWDATVGLTYFPFRYKQVRLNAEVIYMSRSPIGYTAVPYVVGGKGVVGTFNIGTWF